MFKIFKKYKNNINIKMTDKNGVKEDFLDVDDPIGGQNFVCLSFVSPEDVMQNKEAFKTAKFLQSYSKDKGLEFKKVYEDFLDFQYKFQDDIQKDFDSENKFKTNVRGVKVRGVYSSKEEAEIRAKRLQSKDQNFHVFVGQVGYWLPWNPCADKIEDEKFLNNGLNELMEKYKENNISKDLIYEEDKREKIKKAQEEKINAEKLKLEEKIEDINSDLETIGDTNIDESLKDSLNEVDPWLQNKINNEFPDSEPSPDGSICSDEENSKVVADEPKPEDCEK
tara:strand:- start:282 stop:1121 length:840 start_codon:yes stop_codon:yes gene_type:complete